MSSFDVMAARGVAFRADGDGLTITSDRGNQKVPAPKGVATALATINGAPASLTDLSASLMRSQAPLQELGVLQGMVRRLVDLGYLDRVAARDGHLVARLQRKGVLPLVETRPTAAMRLSRHVVALPDGDGFRFDSGLASGTVWVHGPLAGELLDHDLGSESLRDLGALLWRAGLAVEASQADHADVRSDETRFEHRIWDPVELLATQLAIEARAGQPYGGTYRFEGEVPPPPIVDPDVPVEQAVPYPPFDPAQWRGDPPYGQVVAQRASHLDFTTGPAPSLATLVSVLRRSTMIREHIQDDHGLQANRRLVAAGGGVHEVDLYVVVDNVEGLAPGLYRNEPVDEVLQRLNTKVDPAALIDASAGALRLRNRPAFLVLFIARFGRLMWKYEGVALSLILKNAGILTHALYLAATVEGLGSCAQGGGSSSLFTEVTGLGMPSHGLVGQMVFGPVEQL